MNMKNKVVLITGADGFIGSHLVEMLIVKGCKIKALSQYNSFNNWGWLEDVNCKGRVEILTGDIRDPHYCKFITKDVNIIFHLAALIAIPYSYIAPDSYIDTNIKGTLCTPQQAKCTAQRNMCQLMKIILCRHNLHIVPLKLPLMQWQ
jgi:nucleoside-diphosphate-sugar epimerase